MMTLTMVAWILASSSAPVSAPASAANAYQLKTEWRAEDGKKVVLAKRYAGEPVIMSFVYTSCGATCPLTTKNLQRLEQAMKKANKRSRILVVSLDPKHDTPNAVKAYRQRYGLNGNTNWEVLVGDEGELRKLTMLLDFRFSTNVESGAIMHDNKIFLLSEHGEVLFTAGSLDEDQAPLLAAIK